MRQRGCYEGTARRPEDDRMLASVEDLDPVLAIYGDARHLNE